MQFRNTAGFHGRRGACPPFSTRFDGLTLLFVSLPAGVFLALAVGCCVDAFRRRGAARRRLPFDSRNIAGEEQGSPASRVQILNLRVNEFARDIEAGLAARRQCFDGLIEAADEEIARLRRRLETIDRDASPADEIVAATPPRAEAIVGNDFLPFNASRRPSGPHRPARQSPFPHFDAARRMLLLAERGHTVAEISSATSYPPEEIAALLDALRALEKNDAA
jgi:hypothetical protein